MRPLIYTVNPGNVPYPCAIPGEGVARNGRYEGRAAFCASCSMPWWALFYLKKL